MTAEMTHAAEGAAHWRECGQCGLCSVMPALQPGKVAACPRCGNVLWRMRRSPFGFALACGVAAVFFYLFALIAPFLEISAYGRFQLASIETGPMQLAGQSFALVGGLVLAVSVICPGVLLGILLVTLLGLEVRRPPVALLKAVFAWYRPLKPWAMVDVYLLGFLVAYTRLSAIAVVHLDTAVYALIGLMVMMAASNAALDPEAVWQALDAAAPVAPLPVGGAIVGCHVCEMVNDAAQAGCRRCGARLRRRKPDSVGRCTAFVLAAAMLYVPANAYPVMEITQLAKAQPFTIMGGIAELAHYGLWPLALLVFFASITIPVVKLAALGYMLVMTQRRSTRHLVGRTQAFRLVDFIGRWSMIDVFMISILVALVRFGRFANISADVGAACFAGVVVLTMLAVECFDPRLMWDAAA